jgi:hypothetical protein
VKFFLIPEERVSDIPERAREARGGEEEQEERRTAA